MWIPNRILKTAALVVRSVLAAKNVLAVLVNAPPGRRIVVEPVWIQIVTPAIAALVPTHVPPVRSASAVVVKLHVPQDKLHAVVSV